jgi:hypothetical protein
MKIRLGVLKSLIVSTKPNNIKNEYNCICNHHSALYIYLAYLATTKKIDKTWIQNMWGNLWCFRALKTFSSRQNRRRDNRGWV